MAEFSNDAAAAIKNTINGISRSNNEDLNYMTIPQIKAAQEIIKNKMNGDVDPTIKSKFERLNAQYNHAIDKIDKAYRKTLAVAREEGRTSVISIVEGKRDLITIAKIANAPAHRSHIDKKNLNEYTRTDATVDFFKTLNKDIPLAKVGLGVGIGLAGLGAISLIPGSMGAIGGFLAANPAFTALLASGAAIALAVKVVPAVYKAAKKVQANRAAMESAKVDVNEAAYAAQEGVRLSTGTLTATDFSPKNYEANKETLISRLVSDPTWFEAHQHEFSGLELENLKKANRAAKAQIRKNKEEDRKNDRDDKRADREERNQQNVDEILDAILDGKSDESIKELLRNHPNLYDRVSESAELTKEDKERLKKLKEDLDKENTNENKEPTNEEPTNEEPTNEEPTNEEPTNEEPTNEEPTNEEPTNEEPTNEEPTNEEPTNEEPTNEEPTNEEPTNEEPTNEEPTNEEPTNEEPTNENNGRATIAWDLDKCKDFIKNNYNNPFFKANLAHAQKGNGRYYLEPEMADKILECVNKLKEAENAKGSALETEEINEIVNQL